MEAPFSPISPDPTLSGFLLSGETNIKDFKIHKNEANCGGWGGMVRSPLLEWRPEG